MKQLLLLLMLTTVMITGVTAQTAQELYDEGVKLKNDNKSALAIEKFSAAIRQKNFYYDAIYEMGWCRNDTKDYAGAMASLKKVRGPWSNVPKVFFELGYSFEKQSMYDSAVACYNRCLELKPDYALAFKQLSYVAYVKENYPVALSRAQQYIGAAKTEIKDYLFWYRKGFTENAEKKFTEAKESLQKSLLYKKDYANTYLELGFACNRLKQADEAISWYNEAVKLDPNSHIPYNGIGEVYRDTKKDRVQAMTWYQKALAINPDERKARFGMGYCLNSEGKYADAIPHLKKAIEKEATYTAAFVELGYSYYMTENDAAALEQFAKALQMNPKNENARYYSGLVYIAQKNKVKAQQMADELKTLSSPNAATLQAKVNSL